MYTDIKTILDDANKNNYAVLAASAFNMELARGLIAAADEMQAPLIILMGQAQMTKHARPANMPTADGRKISVSRRQSDTPPAVTCSETGLSQKDSQRRFF